jgi:crotonobetainyl-CoA:carnitine CoA-transferase CaiB-like acyl-CoA transferase
VQPLAGALVVDLTRYLPGAYASRELLRLGARIVHVESPDGDPLRRTAPTWHARLRAGVESVACDLKREAAFAHALCARADVVLEGFRPGVAARLGIGPADVPGSVVYCSITGFGEGSTHALRAGHDLNYLGFAGALEDTAALPPIQVADLAAGGLGAVTQILAALLERERTGEGARIVISMTHRAHDLVSHRVDETPLPRLLTGGLACYRIYATADDRRLTVAALEPKFFARLCELLERPDLAPLQHGPDQERLASELASLFATRSLEEWLDLFQGEDACIGPVATLAEAADELGLEKTPATAPELGRHTSAWRRELRLDQAL